MNNYEVEDQAQLEFVCRNGPVDFAKLSSRQRLSQMRHQLLRDFAASKDYGVGGIIAGTTECGKTATIVEYLWNMLVATARRSHGMPSSYPSIRLTKASALGACFAFGQVDFSAGGEVDLARRADLTIIEDMGRETEIGVPALVEVIDYRADRSMPTLSTTGFTMEQFELRYSDAIARRLYKTGGRSRKLINLHGKFIEPERKCPPDDRPRFIIGSGKPKGDVIGAKEIDDLLKTMFAGNTNRATMRESLDKQREALEKWEGAAE